MQVDQTQIKFKGWNILLEQGEIQIYQEDNFATLYFNSEVSSKANPNIGTQQFPCNTLGDAVSLYESLVKGDVECLVH